MMTSAQTIHRRLDSSIDTARYARCALRARRIARRRFMKRLVAFVRALAQGDVPRRTRHASRPVWAD